MKRPKQLQRRKPYKKVTCSEIPSEIKILNEYKNIDETEFELLFGYKYVLSGENNYVFRHNSPSINGIFLIIEKTLTKEEYKLLVKSVKEVIVYLFLKFEEIEYDY
jgi:hypothetical protein